MPAEPAPAVSWMQVLDRIEQALAESLARAALPEEGAAAGPPAGAAEAALAALDGRLAQMEGCLERAEGEAAGADALLAAEAEGLRGWLAALTATRQRLAEQGGRGL
jgi:hypothetical protein